MISGAGRRGTILAAAALAVIAACSVSDDASSDLSAPPSDTLGAAGFDNTPTIYFTDLESGPGSGGENDAGAFVAIRGRGSVPCGTSRR
ncbi:MAG: hypothetical protein M5T61_07130 [Acidimicrobiia bacterium]|nr:hypothetical protein [Acidimicrobiia bacterium]